MKSGLCSAPQNSFLHACASFLERAAKIRLVLLSAKTMLCCFPVLILVLEGSREEHTEVALWAQECFRDGMNQFPWLE